MAAEDPTVIQTQYDLLEEKSYSLLCESNDDGHRESSFATGHLQVNSMDTQASRKRHGEGDFHEDGQVKHYRFLHKPCQQSTTNGAGTGKAKTPGNYQDDKECCLSTDDVMDKSSYQERGASPDKKLQEQEQEQPDPEQYPNSQDDQDDDPDWDVIARTTPASEYVPIFLAARDRRNEAEARFETALDLAHSNLKDLIDSLCGIAADVINGRRVRLDELEADIKHNFVENETKRDHMSKKLVQFAANAQAQFQELMNRLVNTTNGNDFVCD
mmetsp:Transcript_17275/g.32710  ORF Transcript_17275/g.32710 Transcript_17275/m.32710 type:complete len:271 (+) Transcript_17275:678-1490(+)